jgi:hypothetical protein
MKKLLILFVSFIAITGTISGLAITLDHSGSVLGLPIRIPEKTMFRNFFIPGIALTTVGIINAITVVLLIKNNKRQYNAAIVSGLLIGGWIIGHMLLIGNLNWLHLTYLSLSFFVILITFQLKGKWSV